MPDMTRIVDDIRGFLLSYDQTMRDEVRTLATEYAQACANANKRLAKCQRQLQQGLRVEALHNSRESPDLLELIQTADFPERLAWLEVVSLYNLTSPPEFDAIAIEFLQSAYIEDDPLKDLLKGHRRLALMRAPLRQRIEVLRQLAAKDEHNAIWNIDIKGFETVRLEQIKKEANEAKRRRDLPVLSVLHAELNAKGWLAPLPPKLTREIGSEIDKIRRDAALEELRELVDKLNDAFNRVDSDEALRHRTRWREIESRFTAIVDPAMHSEVEPVFLWLAETDDRIRGDDEYQLALEELERGLADQLPRIDLGTLLQHALSYHRGIPEELEASFKARIDQFDAASKWKTIVTIAVVVVMLTMFCGLLLLIKK